MKAKYLAVGTSILLFWLHTGLWRNVGFSVLHLFLPPVTALKSRSFSPVALGERIAPLGPDLRWKILVLPVIIKINCHPLLNLPAKVSV